MWERGNGIIRNVAIAIQKCPQNILASLANFTKLLIEVFVETYAKKLQSNASYVSLHYPTQLPCTPLNLALIFLFPRSTSSVRFFRSLEIIFVCVFLSVNTMMQHVYAAVCFFGNSLRKRRLLTLTLGISPNVKQFSHFLYSTDFVRSTNVY